MTFRRTLPSVPTAPTPAAQARDSDALVAGRQDSGPSGPTEGLGTQAGLRIRLRPSTAINTSKCFSILLHMKLTRSISEPESAAALVDSSSAVSLESCASGDASADDSDDDDGSVIGILEEAPSDSELEWAVDLFEAAAVEQALLAVPEYNEFIANKRARQH